MTIQITIYEIRVKTSKFISESENVWFTNKNKAIHKMLTNISKNKIINCLRMDKGTRVVILNSAKYISKKNKVLEDKSKLKKLGFESEL